MKKNLLVWQVGGLTFTAVLGTLLHFLYEWTGLKGLAVISAVNESTWEHMKLVFLPSFIFAIIQSFLRGEDYKSFWVVKAIGILIGTVSIPVLFYTLGGSFGKLSAITNIAIFFLSVGIEYFVELYLFNKINCKPYLKWVSLGVLLILFILFIVFSFNPPKIPLFLDPLTNGYGIVK